jgi:tRNA(Phe) wybutosine-synthesizing methylase Tyw3
MASEDDVNRRARAHAEVLAQFRQMRWNELGRWHQAWPEAARDAYATTVKLNGHGDDIDGNRHRAYEAGGSGLWGELRREMSRRSTHAHASPELDALMRKNRGAASGYPGADDLAERDLAELSAQQGMALMGKLDEGKGTAKSRALIVDGAGFDHDRVLLVYWELERRFSLAEHHVALTRRGPLPHVMREAQEDAERIVRTLNEAGIPKTEIARLFECSRKTVTRICTNEIVPLSPKGRGEVFVITEILARFDAQDQALLRIENTLAAVVDALLNANRPAYDDAVAQFDELLLPEKLEEAA